MPNTHGFIKLSRSITACDWFGDNNTLAVLVRLTLLAEWQSTVSRGVELKRGQLIATIPQIAQISQLSVQQTRTILDRLKSTGRITVKSTPKFSVITLNDFDGNSKINSQGSRQTAENQQSVQQPINRPSLLYKDNKNLRIEEHTPELRQLIDEAVSEYNDICTSLEPFREEASYQQAQLIIKAQGELHGISFREYFARVEKSEFLTGKGKSSFKADFNWLIRPENVAKVLSGKYDVSYGTTDQKPQAKNYNAPLW